MLCRFCKFEFSAKDVQFCSSCGEKVRQKRIGIGSLLEVIGDDFFGFEKGFWFTLYMLIKDPALVVKSYIHGARKKFHSPAKMYGVILFLSLIVYSNTGTFTVQYKDGVASGYNNRFSISKSNDKNQTKVKKVSDEKKMQQVMQHFERNFRTYLQVFFLAWIPISALFLWLFFAYRKFTIGESLVVGGYLTGLTQFFGLLNEVITYFFPNRIDKGYGLIEAFTVVVYYYIVRQIYYRAGRRFHLRFVGFLLSSFSLYTVTVGGAMLIAIWPYLTAN